MNIKDFDSKRQSALAKWIELTESKDIPVIYIGAASCGKAAGAMNVLAVIHKTLAEIGSNARVVQVGCIGPCYLEPLMDITLPDRPRVSYANVTPDKAKKILVSCLEKGDILAGMAQGHFGDETFTTRTGISRFFNLPMLKHQVRIVLRNCGLIDPDDIDHYLARDGYLGFIKAIEVGPQAVLTELKESGLRGRGGAGFPTYKKWELCQASKGNPKYVICNADEGDPGAFMNRALIESDPHSVLEGLLIAGYTIGASQGIIYVRAEYPLAVLRLKKAIEQMRSYSLLGEDILGTGLNFDLTIREGAGAFVCGEETALISSLEGKRGIPTPRPPYPADKGLYGKPTLINNTETFATVPAIILNGGQWFRQYGTTENTGTKTFSLVGKVRYTGLIEVPLGMTLRQIVTDIGGGTQQPFKAIQTGGPLGGCLPESKLDTPITYETMRENGSIMGSGGLIVMDESTCMVEIAKFFIGFAMKESCGNCTPCRIGTRILMDTLDRIARGEGESRDLDIMRKVAATMSATSLCGLGQAASNPVSSSLNYFLSEYEIHIHEKYCPTAVCDDLFEYHILAEKCSGCGLCIDVCTPKAISGKRKEPHFLDTSRCIKCHSCVRICTRRAIAGRPIFKDRNIAIPIEAMI